MQQVSMKGKGKNSMGTVYEVRENERSAFTFNIFCFFEGLHTIQGELRKTWKTCVAGELDFVAACLIVTASIELVSRAEKDLLWENPGFIDANHSYRDMTSSVFYNHTHSAQDSCRPRVTPVTISVCRRAMRFLPSWSSCICPLGVR